MTNQRRPGAASANCACEISGPGSPPPGQARLEQRLAPATVDEVVRFHGHMCAGLAVGIRAAEVALREVGQNSSDEPVVALVETGMCAVDAIQYLNGCTLGKGNLVHLDHGKNVYTFIRRGDGKAIRISGRPGVVDVDADQRALFRKVLERTATLEEQARFQELQRDRSRKILEMPERELFAVDYPDVEAPPPALIHASVNCDSCGEPTMETRVALLEGDQLCPPCYGARAADPESEAAEPVR